MLISRFIRLLRAWWRYNESVRELARLNDRELADIGISRSEITRLPGRTPARSLTPQPIAKTPASPAGVFVCGEQARRTAISRFHFSSFRMSGYSPLLWVQPSMAHFWPLSFSRITALVCGRLPNAAARLRHVDRVMAQQPKLARSQQDVDRVAVLSRQSNCEGSPAWPSPARALAFAVPASAATRFSNHAMVAANARGARRSRPRAAEKKCRICAMSTGPQENRRPVGATEAVAHDRPRRIWAPAARGYSSVLTTAEIELDRGRPARRRKPETPATAKALGRTTNAHARPALDPRLIEESVGLTGPRFN